MTRYLTVEGFLFTAFAAAIGGFYLTNELPFQRFLWFVCLIIAGISIFISYFAGKAIHLAAIQTMRASYWFEKNDGSDLNLHALYEDVNGDTEKKDPDFKTHIEKFSKKDRSSCRIKKYYDRCIDFILGDTEAKLYTNVLCFAWVILAFCIFVILGPVIDQSREKNDRGQDVTPDMVDASLATKPEGILPNEAGTNSGISDQHEHKQTQPVIQNNYSFIRNTTFQSKNESDQCQFERDQLSHEAVCRNRSLCGVRGGHGRQK